jgi:hypothetical protein
MENSDFTQRIAIPTSIVLIAMILSRIIYFNTSATVATLSGIVMFLSIGFGTLLIYPMSFFRGATLFERVMGCLVTPLVWNGIEIYNTSEAFTPAEAIFYGLNILFLGTVSGQFIMMGVSDLCCRWIAGRRGKGERKQSPAFAVIAILFGITGVYFVLLWREGAGLMYLFVKIYKILFV